MLLAILWWALSNKPNFLLNFSANYFEFELDEAICHSLFMPTIQWSSICTVKEPLARERLLHFP